MLQNSLKRIRRRAGKTIGALSQEFVRLLAEDEEGRCLEVVSEWQGTDPFLINI